MAHQELDERKSAILSQIIEEYVACAEPVGSKMIVDKYDWEVSPATMRSEMSALEEEGYMTHPYTSAGRIPTEQGFRWYVSSLDVQSLGVPSKFQTRLSNTLARGNASGDQSRLKEVAREVAEVAKLAVVVGFGRNSSYYTGLSLLFSNPEFESVSAIRSFSEVLDQLDEALESARDRLEDGTNVEIGEENPFGSDCALVMSTVGQGDWVFGILGPLRMDYKKTIGLVNWVRENI